MAARADKTKRAKKKRPYIKDDNPALQKVVRGLRSVEDLERKGSKDLVLAAARLEGKPRMKGMSGKRAS